MILYCRSFCGKVLRDGVKGSSNGYSVIRISRCERRHLSDHPVAQSFGLAQKWTVTGVEVLRPPSDPRLRQERVLCDKWDGVVHQTVRIGAPPLVDRLFPRW